MKKKRLIIYILQFTFIFAFFTTTVFMSKKKDGSLRFVSFQKMRADYEFFWNFIYEGYPFTEVCERQGADLKKIKNEGYIELRNIKNQKEYYTFYDKLCKKITSDKKTGHLFPIHYKDYSDSLSSQGSYDVLNDKNKIIDKFYMEWQKRDGKIYHKNKTYAEKKIILENKIAYIKIHSFSTFTYEQQKLYEDEINNFLMETAGYEHIIIDITSNRGGSIDNCKLIIGPNITGNKQVAFYGLYNENKYTKPYLDHIFKKINIEKINLNDIPKVKNSNTIKNDKAYIRRESISWQYLNGYKPCKNKKFWLLIGKLSYSASDRFAYMCKQSGFATLIGENTGGAGVNAYWPMHIFLPNSGLLILFDFTYGLNSEGYCADEFGNFPDIYNQPGKDALETCLEEIKRLEENINNVELYRD